MKKVLALLLAALMCLSFVACEEEEEPEELLLTNDEGLVMINEHRFGECIDEVVELTVENFKDYFDVISYTETVVEKDAFGEVVSTQEVEHRILCVKTEKYHRYEDVVIELKNKETEELIVFEEIPCFLEYHRNFSSNPKKVKEFDISKYECTRIKGRIYFVTLPEEAVRSLEEEWGYDCGFVLGSLGRPYRIDPFTKEIYHNGTENWQEKYMTK